MPLLFGNTAASGASSPNYFGTSANGSVTYATTTSLVVPNKNGGYDGDMVVMNYSDLTINSGVTLTTDQPCRGMLIYVSGNCTINGTLSIKGRGAYANPTVSGASDGNAVPSGGLQLPFRTASGTSSLSASAALFNGTGTAARTAISNHATLASNGTVITLVRQGAAGGSRTPGGQAPISPNAGSNGSTGQTGGGGSGGGYYISGIAGAGSYGSCFGGGSGGGGIHSSGGGTGYDATAWGGPGGNGYYPDGGYSAPGGIGNGNGTWSSTNTLYGNNGTANTISGTGGLLILIVGGTLTIGSSGTITADGITGPTTNQPNERAGGGASGGGNVVVAYRDALNNSGAITANGGSRWGWGDQTGGAGGNGSVQTLQVL